ncbi:MAG: MFS transporter [Chitinophagaceae bacterium]|nr:MFS transporter [Chitinophagaceae bacterium]
MKHQWKPLLLVAYVFLFVGSIICMNDILLPSLKDFFHLSYVEASMVQQSFYLVYLIFPIPIAYYIAKYGYKRALFTALVICGAGGMLFIPAYYLLSLTLALIAVFVISLGVTLVNVAANPLATLLGDPAGAHVRVNFVQLFSRIGFSFTPIIATRLIYSNTGNITFHVPYMLLAAGTLIFAIFIFFSSLPALKPGVEKGFNFTSIVKESRRHPQLFWGVVAMFFEMGAESCTPGFFINYLREVSGFTTDQTATYLTYYYISSTIMCVIGIFLLQVFPAGRLVAIFGVGMVTMYLLAVFTKSDMNPYYMLGMGAFISIVFPSIFSLALEGVGGFTEKGSALINMAVVGGAVFPPLQGALADAQGVQFSYLVPCMCFVVVVFYGIYCDRHGRTLAMGNLRTQE